MKSEQNPLKVLLLTTSFPLSRKSRSGVFIQKMIRCLPAHVQVTVLTPDGTEGGLPISANYTVFPFRYAPKSWQQLAHGAGGIMAALARNKLFFLLLPFFLCSHLLTCCWLTRKVDVLHANWSINGVIAGIAGLLFGKPVVTTLRGSDVNLMEKSGVMHSLVHFCLRFSAAVVTVSPSLEQKLTEYFPQYSAKIGVICNGIDQDFFTAAEELQKATEGNDGHSASGQGNKAVRFVYVGNLVPGKGVDVILQAAASLSAENWLLDIIGDGPERKALEAFCQEQELVTQVSFHGAAPPEDIPGLMARSDVFVFASFAEGRPNVVLEAMAVGLPVIAGAIPAVSELIENGQQGLLFPPGDVSALAEHMALLIKEPLTRQRLGEKAREYLYLLGLSWSESARDYARLYTEVATKN
ncbi:MAG: glycosyltransferase [Candidatus Electrothrix aestuarii]|uniref:Glycosyltransferase n=1 Tax=Candidatus Electrothrix aestuarii TaxID=3062594 RepID=A0AAU8LRN9_9BACT|nr:glycosyltransferase [Candidatus Electrothrix aestuarii]